MHAKETAESDRALRRDWTLFTLLTFLFGFGFAVYNGVFQNFLRERLSVGPMQLGGLECLREMPGLLAALLAGTLATLAESRVASLGLLVTAVGVAVTGRAGGYWQVVAVSVFWSAGFHLYSSVSPAITLALAKGREGGRHLGRMSAVGATATLTALGLAWLVSQFELKPAYGSYFLLAGACIAAAALLSARLSAHAEGAPRARLILRREYGLYYLLIFLEGCRRQVFGIFASYTLIAVYHVPLHRMLALQFVNAILISITAPRMGRLLDRVGERGPLLFYALALTAVFVGYATIRVLGVLYALYLIDNILFSFGVGFTTYLHRIVRKGELTPCLVMGTTMNHVAAVTVPLAGSWLWQHYHNYQVPFWMGAGIAMVSFFNTRRLPHGPAPVSAHRSAPESGLKSEAAPALEEG